MKDENFAVFSMVNYHIFLVVILPITLILLAILIYQDTCGTFISTISFKHLSELLSTTIHLSQLLIKCSI